MPLASSARASARRARGGQRDLRVHAKRQGLLLALVAIAHSPVLPCRFHVQKHAFAVGVLVAGGRAGVLHLANKCVSYWHGKVDLLVPGSRRFYGYKLQYQQNGGMGIAFTNIDETRKNPRHL